MAGGGVITEKGVLPGENDQLRQKTHALPSGAKCPVAIDRDHQNAASEKCLTKRKQRLCDRPEVNFDGQLEKVRVFGIRQPVSDWN